MSIPDISRLFVRLKVPYPMIPRGGKRVAGRVAKDFSAFIDGICLGYNETHGTDLESAQALVHLLNQNVPPERLFADYRPIAEQARQFIGGKWLGAKGYDDGWKWLNKDFALWFLYQILPRPCELDDGEVFSGRSDLSKTLAEHPRGEEWMIGFVDQLRGFLYPGR